MVLKLILHSSPEPFRKRVRANSIPGALLQCTAMHREQTWLSGTVPRQILDSHRRKAPQTAHDITRGYQSTPQHVPDE
eukprot:757413-Hanusia_phi.AAC.6